ncbi:acyltransferase family protein [Bradyrhizobium sp. RDM4]|uniref:acyltransferase family protein n=1 Tax=Bradyrhizobium sp. RDM4 TaxID=3378765 RepID=UPI0038FD0D01
MSKSASEINRNRYQSLDAMRGLAAIAVAAGHFNSSYVQSSYLAVDFFFILSGFVIGNAYASKLNGGMTPVAFMWVRLVRLWPLFRHRNRHWTRADIILGQCRAEPSFRR